MNQDWEQFPYDFKMPTDPNVTLHYPGGTFSDFMLDVLPTFFSFVYDCKGDLVNVDPAHFPVGFTEQTLGQVTVEANALVNTAVFTVGSGWSEETINLLKFCVDLVLDLLHVFSEISLFIAVSDKPLELALYEQIPL